MFFKICGGTPLGGDMFSHPIVILPISNCLGGGFGGPGGGFGAPGVFVFPMFSVAVIWISMLFPPLSILFSDVLFEELQERGRLTGAKG